MKPGGKKIMIWAVALIGIALVANVILFLFKASPFNLVEINLAKAVAAADIASVEVKSNVGDVNIIPFDGSEIRVTMKGKTERKWLDDYSLDVSQNGDIVTVNATQKEQKKYLSFTDGSYKLQIQLPRKQYHTIQVQTITANIHVEDIQTLNTKLGAVNGNITTANLEGELLGTTEIGDIKAHFRTITKGIEARAKYGNVAVTVSEAPAKFQTDLRASLGKEILDLSNAMESGNEGPLIALSSELGDVALEQREIKNR